MNAWQILGAAVLAAIVLYDLARTWREAER